MLLHCVTVHVCHAGMLHNPTYWHIALVRESIHTIALYSGWPVLRRHSTVVSRWLVRPTALTCRAFGSVSAPSCGFPPASGDAAAASDAARETASRMHTRTVWRIVSGSCSTHLQHREEERWVVGRETQFCVHPTTYQRHLLVKSTHQTGPAHAEILMSSIAYPACG